jgi:hypothetical protein
MKFGTLDYYKMYADVLNKDAEFQKNGSKLTTTFLFVFEDLNNADGSPKAFLLDIVNGKVTAVEANAYQKVDFSTTANYAMQASIAKGEIPATNAKTKFDMRKGIMNMKPLQRIGNLSKELKDVEY